MSEKVIYKTREEWLVAAVDMIRPSFEKENAKIPEKLKVSIGFPPKGGLAKRRVLGVCCMPAMASDGLPQIYINPTIEHIGGSCGILAVLVHECVHACGISGHGEAFKRIALAVGLEGKMTSTTATSWLQDFFEHMMEVLGAFPYAHLIGKSVIQKEKPDKCRMHKCICPQCGYTVRIANKWIERGIPACPDCEIELEKEIKE